VLAALPTDPAEVRRCGASRSSISSCTCGLRFRPLVPRGPRLASQRARPRKRLAPSPSRRIHRTMSEHTEQARFLGKRPSAPEQRHDGRKRLRLPDLPSGGESPREDWCLKVA